VKNKKNLIAAIPVVLFLVGWEILARNKVVNQALFPPPTVIAVELADLFFKGLPVQSELLNHVGETLVRVGLSFSLGLLVGMILGVAMGLSRLTYFFFNPLITMLMPIPGIALAPLFIVWFGFGNETIIPLGVLSAFFPVVYTTVAGVRSVDRQLVQAAQIMGASRWKVISSVYLPWAAVYVFNGMKLGLARCWMTVIAVEFIAATNWGLGYLILSSSDNMRADIVYGGIFLLIVIYFVLERGVIHTLENRTIARWGMIHST